MTPERMTPDKATELPAIKTDKNPTAAATSGPAASKKAALANAAAKKAIVKSSAKSAKSVSAATSKKRPKLKKPIAKSPKKKADVKPAAAKKSATKPAPKAATTAKVLDSQVEYQGPLFRVVRDHIIEPNGQESYRDVIRHNGSVVILAVNPGKKKKDPWVVIERQYRHAAGQYLWELPAGKLDGGETGLEGAMRELAEETGYKAEKWSPLVEYFASPGFLGESMKVFLAEGLVAGDAHPEADEHIDFRLVKLSEVLAMVDKGKIIDGKTLTTVLLYARRLGLRLKD